MNRNDFINMVAPFVQYSNQRRGNLLFSSVVIAQAILETGWGNSETMLRSNALFGIKATTSWKGKVYSAKTKECYDGISFTTITDCFRAYDSIEDSVDDYFSLICNASRYKNALNRNSHEECITAIKEGGYATDPYYIDSILRIIKENNLTKFDHIAPSYYNYVADKIYTLKVDLKVRRGAGTEFEQKNYSELTEDGKRHAYQQQKAVLKKGTNVTCKSTYIKDNEVWLEIPSGYVAGYYQGKLYIE